jgi:hypothetical protein
MKPTFGVILFYFWHFGRITDTKRHIMSFSVISYYMPKVCIIKPKKLFMGSLKMCMGSTKILKHEPSLKKSGDFAVPEGHGYPLVKI